MTSHNADPENEAKTVPSVHKVMGASFGMLRMRIGQVFAMRENIRATNLPSSASEAFIPKH
jgi:hypothetical protein